MAAIAAVWMGLLIVVAAGPQDQHPGWKFPPSAADDKNPFPVNDAILAGGRKIFINKCVRCHGPKGEGDGEDADIKLKLEMDLTRADRADRESGRDRLRESLERDARNRRCRRSRISCRKNKPGRSWRIRRRSRKK